MVANYLKDHPIVFNDNVVVGLPPVTEDQTHVPIMIDARKLGRVDEIVVLGDLSPFPLTLKVRPHGSPAFVAFRMRIEQATAIRAAVLKDGTWHVGGKFLDAAGGGCEAPPATEAKLDWSTIGQMRGKIWRDDPDTLRLRLRVVHPMDTGLEKNPAFYIETMNIKDASGNMLCDVDVRSRSPTIQPSPSCSPIRRPATTSPSQRATVTAGSSTPRCRSTISSRPTT